MCRSDVAQLTFIAAADRCQISVTSQLFPLLSVSRAGRPLHLGRKVRLATRDQWTAASVWHRECVVPGCDRPAQWCHMHHAEFWTNGGPTDLENLPLVCTKHHHLIHDAGWRIRRLPDGTWQLIRPNGTLVDPVRYPGHHRPRARPPDEGCRDEEASRSA